MTVDVESKQIITLGRRIYQVDLNDFCCALVAALCRRGIHRLGIDIEPLLKECIEIGCDYGIEFTFPVELVLSQFLGVAILHNLASVSETGITLLLDDEQAINFQDELIAHGRLRITDADIYREMAKKF